MGWALIWELWGRSASRLIGAVGRMRSPGPHWLSALGCHLHLEATLRFWYSSRAALGDSPYLWHLLGAHLLRSGPPGLLLWLKVYAFATLILTAKLPHGSTERNKRVTENRCVSPRGHESWASENCASHMCSLCYNLFLS